VDHSLSTFLSGCAPFGDLVFFAKSLDELTEAGTENSTFLFFDAGKTARLGESVGWPAISMATLKPEGGDRLVWALGPQGQLWECAPSSGADRTGQIGVGSHAWRALAVVSGQLYACGMDRMVAERTSAGAWRALGAPGGTEGEGVVGFEALDGFSPDDLYAVGWRGELWHRQRQRWRRLPSPTTANLNAVCCAEDGVVYAAGDGGVLLAGRDDRWRQVPTGVTEDLRDVRDAGGRVYVASDFSVRELTPNGLRSLAAQGDPPHSCLRLLKTADGLVSLGPRDLVQLSEGKWVSLA
jgi:hypothetical protein